MFKRFKKIRKACGYEKKEVVFTWPEGGFYEVEKLSTSDTNKYNSVWKYVAKLETSSTEHIDYVYLNECLQAA